MSGLNRTELIIGLLLLCLFGALATPWFLTQRDQARRHQCRDNLRRIGEAVEQYAVIHAGRPNPYGTWMNAGLPPEKRLAWTLPIAVMHDKNVAAAFDVGEAWSDENNRRASVGEGDDAVSFRRFPLFHCPANQNPGPEAELLHSSYVGMAGLGPDAPALETLTPEAGVWGYNRQTRLAQVVDGSEFTFSVLETDRNNGPWTAGAEPTIRPFLPGETPIGPGEQFGGRHPEGSTVLFVDGSVRTFSNSTDPEAFSRLCTAASNPVAEE